VVTGSNPFALNSIVQIPYVISDHEANKSINPAGIQGSLNSD
jgi:hypothetical protein